MRREARARRCLPAGLRDIASASSRRSVPPLRRSLPPLHFDDTAYIFLRARRNDFSDFIEIKTKFASNCALFDDAGTQ